jgi:two-component system, chemotaxis family, protein-glutamate methylesterase/glutaminase
MNCFAMRAETGTEPVTLHARIRTLVVDDSPFMLKVLAQILEETDFFDLVGTATDAYQALRHVSALAPELVMMDIHMPGLNGIQAARFMKRSEHPPVVILISSDSTSMTRSLAEQAGADGFVSKGGDFRHRVIRTLQKLFRTGGAMR